MGLREAIRALWTPATAPDLEVEVGVHDVHTQARDIHPNELHGDSGRGGGGSFYEAASAVMNMATGQGTGADPSEFTKWAIPRQLRWRERFGMGRNALIQQALGKLPNTATGKGWRVLITDPDVPVDDRQGVSDEIAAYEKRLKLPQRINRALIRGRQHRQALVVLGIDDGRAFDQPVDKDAIRTIRWAVTIDARDFTSLTLAPPTSEHYGGVEVYQITDVNGILEDGLRYGEDSISYTNERWDELLDEHRASAATMLVHADRVLSFATPDYFSLLDSLQDSLGAFFETMGGIRTAARESSMIKYKINDLKRKMWSKNSNLAREHMNMVQRAKSAINAFVVDADEDVSVLSRPLAGVGDLANPIMTWVAAALNIPTTEFWKVTPGGFGKGDSERATFHEDTGTYQEQQVEPELTKAHGYILAAKDGLELPFDTQRDIEFNDLTPPDEVQASELRSKAILDLRQLADAGYISRPELRTALGGLNDEYFRLELDKEFVDRPNPAQVGIFTGSLEALTSVYGEGATPPSAIRALLLALDPVHFNLKNIFKIIPPSPAESSGGEAGGAPGTTPVTPTDPNAPVEPGDEEDAVHEPSDVEIKWAAVAPPPGARTAKELEESPELLADNVKSYHIKRLAREEYIPAYRPRGYSKEPLYMLEEVQRGLLERQGHMSPAQEKSPVQDAGPRALFVSINLPPDLARWVPYKAEDSSPPHVTLAYVKDVPQAIAQDVLDELRQTFASLDPIDVKVHDKPVHYFEVGTDGGRVAYAQAEFAHAQETFDDLVDALESFGLTVEHKGQFNPHVTLAYLGPDEVYSGPAPDGRWITGGIEVSYAGEVESMTLEGRFVEDDEQAVSEDDVDPTRDRGPLIKEGYIWRTQGDSKVRSSHRKLNGKRFRTNTGDPSEGQPGDAPNCRCAKEVIVPPTGTKRAKASAQRTTRRALRRRFDKISGKAAKK